MNTTLISNGRDGACQKGGMTFWYLLSIDPSTHSFDLASIYVGRSVTKEMDI